MSSTRECYHPLSLIQNDLLVRSLNFISLCVAASYAIRSAPTWLIDPNVAEHVRFRDTINGTAFVTVAGAAFQVLILGLYVMKYFRGRDIMWRGQVFRMLTLEMVNDVIMGVVVGVCAVLVIDRSYCRMNPGFYLITTPIVCEIYNGMAAFAVISMIFYAWNIVLDVLKWRAGDSGSSKSGPVQMTPIASSNTALSPPAGGNARPAESPKPRWPPALEDA